MSIHKENEGERKKGGAQEYIRLLHSRQRSRRSEQAGWDLRQGVAAEASAHITGKNAYTHIQSDQIHEAAVGIIHATAQRESHKQPAWARTHLAIV